MPFDEKYNNMPGGLSFEDNDSVFDEDAFEDDMLDVSDLRMPVEIEELLSGLKSGLKDSDLKSEKEPTGEMEEILIDLDGDQKDDIVFMLDPVPGAPDAEDIIEVEEGDIEVSDMGDEVEIDDDPWNWRTKGPGSFIEWLSGMVSNIPRHTGHDTTGLEKAISYFENLDREISKAMRQDFKNEIDSAQAEKAREEIENGLDRLVERLEKVKSTKYKRHSKKKKAWYEPEIVKEASGSARILGITITVPLLISHCARVAVNGTISAGHDIEDMFERLGKEYDLDKQQKAEFGQLLADMGYPMRVDRGFQIGTPVDPTQSDNFDWNANYPG